MTDGEPVLTVGDGVRRCTLAVLADTLAVCRLEPDVPVPDWACAGGLASTTRTDEELSIVCPEGRVPADVTAERGWRCLKVQGPLAFWDAGVLAALAGPLAGAGIALFALSTFETDYLLVKEQDLAKAIQVLMGAGHRVVGSGWRHHGT